MTILFKAKSEEAYRIKILAEVLANNIKTGCFVIDDTGIYLCMMDHHRTILIDVALKAENFLTYKYFSSKGEKRMYIGINLNHFHKMLRSIKKKDSIELFIDDKQPTDLAIQVIPKENNRKTVSFVKIQSVQNLEIDIPTGYTKPVTVPSSDYQKMVKEMSTIGSSMRVTSHRFKIEFSCNAGGILKRKVQFGEDDEDDVIVPSTTGGDDDEDSESKHDYDQEFITEQLCRITKLSGLDSVIQIYPGKPLLFASNVGRLGKINIYIKSKQQIEAENHSNVIESDYSDD